MEHEKTATFAVLICGLFCDPRCEGLYRPFFAMTCRAYDNTVLCFTGKGYLRCAACKREFPEVTGECPGTS